MNEKLHSMEDRHFQRVKWSLTILSTLATLAFVHILHAGNL